MTDIDDLVRIRKSLHMMPELSEQEHRTASIIVSLLKACNPTKIITDVAGTGIICLYDFQKPGPCMVFRAELDALPIHEKNKIEYKSRNDGVSHACGHDGHMSILLGLARYLAYNPDEFRGKVILLFQPAEETATGAKKIMQDQRFQRLEPTHIFGFHNIPSFKQGSILVSNDVFASASQGLILRFHGATSHAGHPEEGINPMQTMLDCIQILQEISSEYTQRNPGSFITIIHVNLGERAFGTSPGEAVIMATFRSFDQHIMNEMTRKSIKRIKETIDRSEVTWDFEWVEVFPAIQNNKNCNQIVTNATVASVMDLIQLQKPFSWTEDFSYYLQRYPGAFFGLGAGENHAALHHPTYDFPDSLISIGVKICRNIILETQKAYTGEEP